MRSYKIYLYRHGLTDGNLDGRYIGVTDLDLCDKGKNELISKKEKFEYPNVGIVYSSPLKRCIQSANILYPDMTPQIVEDIKEYNFGIYENKTAEELKENEEFVKWLQSSMSVPPKNGDDIREFTKRIKNGFNEIILDMMRKKISSSAVITHGGVIMSLLSDCGLPKRTPTDWSVEPGEGYALLINAQLWGNVQSFEICDKIPYRDGDDFDLRPFDLIDVEKLKNM